MYLARDERETDQGRERDRGKHLAIHILCIVLGLSYSMVTLQLAVIFCVELWNLH